MKTKYTLCLLAACAAVTSIRAAETPADTATNAAPGLASPASTSTKAESPPSEPKLVTIPAIASANTDTNGLHLNFRGAPLDMVLNYFSEAAGFTINIKPGTSAKGKVDLWSSQTLTKDEALNLLDTVLNQNGLAAIHNGKTLTIINRDEAKTHDIPVRLESDPDKIPRTDEIVTQIIPVRFVEVGQLTKDLQPLVSLQTSMTANEAGNAIVITDTQANIRRIAEVIKDIDMGAEAFTEVKVFRLVNADPADMADMLSNLFPDESKTGSGQGSVFSRFGGGLRGLFGGGGGPPGFGNQGGGSSGNNGGDQRIKKRARVIAVAEPRTGSVVVSAAKELMEQIAGVISDLDADPRGKQVVSFFKLENTDPQEAQQVLQEMFNKNNTQNNRNPQNQNSALLNRSTTQNQQNNSAANSRAGSSRGGIGGSSIGP
jgi:general secretion pathway protein D